MYLKGNFLRISKMASVFRYLNPFSQYPLKCNIRWFLEKSKDPAEFEIFEIFEILSCSFWDENMFRDRISCLAHRFGIIYQLLSDLNHDFFIFFKILRRIWRKMFQSPSDIAISEQNRNWYENTTKNVTVSIKLSKLCRKPQIHIIFRSEEESVQTNFGKKKT